VNREIARIIDANINRAREAVRVMEDYARFVLNDPASTETLKRYRHDLRECIQQLPADQLLAARNTPADVGTTISTTSERQRTDARHVFVAAAKRLPEALRTIEEYSKTIDINAAAAFEQLRYRAYDLEQRITARGERSACFAQVRLYVLITASLCRHHWLDTASAAIQGGAACLQLREKSLDDKELLARARKLAAMCRDANVLFILNDRPDIALLSDADGVHLGQTDMSLADARQIVGPHRLVGLSTHTSQQLQTAIQQAPDYIAVGPMFDSITKPQDHIAGPSLLQEALQHTDIPIVPVGGIDLENTSILKKQGAQCVCVCSAVIGAENPKLASQSFIGSLAASRCTTSGSSAP